MKRLSDLYNDIDNIMQNNEYYDDDTEETVCDISEEEIYQQLIERNDYRFLTTEAIKDEIHKFFTDWNYRMKKSTNWEENIIMSKLRVWWIPQIGINEIFYVPVNTPEEGKKLLDTLAAYDAFQLQNNVKSDCFNVGGLQMFDEEDEDWYDWNVETDNYFYDDLDKYCESEDCEQAEELENFQKEVFKQIDWSKIPDWFTEIWLNKRYIL